MMRSLERMGAVLFLALVVLASSTLASHDQSDVVLLDDGGSYVGEIKSVRYATLTLSTNAAGTVSIAWRHVTALTSKFSYRFQVTGGDLYYGTMGGATAGSITIVSDDGTATTVALADIVEIVPIEHGFWNRLDGSVSFGLSYTQANSALQYTFSGNANYQTRRTLARLNVLSIFNTQQGGETTNQHNSSLNVIQITKKKWNPFELAQLQSNPDQGYSLRSILGAGASRFFVERAHMLFLFDVGLVGNVEQVADSGGTDQSAELLLGIAFHRFKRGSHSPELQLTLNTFVNVTETPRRRSMLNFQVGWKVVGDFMFNFQINNSYDSDPPGVDSQNNDLSIVTSFGYSF